MSSRRILGKARGESLLQESGNAGRRSAYRHRNVGSDMETNSDNRDVGFLNPASVQPIRKQDGDMEEMQSYLQGEEAPRTNSWRYFGYQKRQTLISKEKEHPKLHGLTSGGRVPIESLYELAAKILAAFDAAFNLTPDEASGMHRLDDAFIYGHRLLLLLLKTIPSHPLYYTDDVRYRRMRLESMVHAKCVYKSMKDVADQMDQNEFNKWRYANAEAQISEAWINEAEKVSREAFEVVPASSPRRAQPECDEKDGTIQAALVSKVDKTGAGDDFMWKPVPRGEPCEVSEDAPCVDFLDDKFFSPPRALTDTEVSRSFDVEEDTAWGDGGPGLTCPPETERIYSDVNCSWLDSSDPVSKIAAAEDKRMNLPDDERLFDINSADTQVEDNACDDPLASNVSTEHRPASSTFQRLKLSWIQRERENTASFSAAKLINAETSNTAKMKSFTNGHKSAENSIGQQADRDIWRTSNMSNKIKTTLSQATSHTASSSMDMSDVSEDPCDRAHFECCTKAVCNRYIAAIEKSWSSSSRGNIPASHGSHNGRMMASSSGAENPDCYADNDNSPDDIDGRPLVEI